MADCKLLPERRNLAERVFMFFNELLHPEKMTAADVRKDFIEVVVEPHQRLLNRSRYDKIHMLSCFRDYGIQIVQLLIKCLSHNTTP